MDVSTDDETRSSKVEFDPDLYLSNSVLSTTASFLFDSSSNLTRIVESVDMREENVTRQTRFDIRSPGSRFLFPVAFASTERLTDLLRIELATAGPAVVLGRADTARVVSAILLAQAATVAMRDDTRPLVDEVCGLLPLASKVDATRLVVAVRERFRDDEGPEGLSHEQQDLLQILFQMCGRRPLLVPISSDEPHVVVNVERSLSALDLSGGGAAENIRFIAARQPQHLRFSLDTALWTSSYHFELRSPHGYYTSSVECSRRIGRGIALQRRVREFEIEKLPKSKDVSGVHADPRGATHVHLRNMLNNAGARNGLLLDIGLKEQPLGDLGSATALALVMLVSNLAVLAYAPYITAIPTQSFTTLIAALPGLLAASVFYRRGGVARGPLAAQVGSALGALSAVSLSVVLAAWTAAAARYRLERPQQIVTVFPAPFGLEYLLWVQTAALGVLASTLIVIVVRNVITFAGAVTRYRSSPMV